MDGPAGEGRAAGAGQHADEEPTSRHLVTGSNVRSAVMTGVLLAGVVVVEGFAFSPMFFFIGVPLGPGMYYVFNAQLDDGERGLATFGTVAAFAAAVLLGHIEGAVWVAIGVDVGTLALAYGERWVSARG